jgi:hypothetical protein
MVSSDRAAETRWLFGIGLEKCGTTFLEAALRATPGFCGPRAMKETVFFAHNFDKGFDWYEDLFSARKPDDICVEFTPYYIHNPTALQRMAAFASQAKVIINLRNPVYRAFSNYWHNIYNHHCLHNSVLPEVSLPRGAAFYSKTFYDEFDARSYLFVRYSALVLRAISIFGRENVLVLVLERDLADLTALEQKLRAFLHRDMSLAAPRSARNGMRTPWVIHGSGDPRVLSLHDEGTVKARRVCVMRNGMKTMLSFEDDDEAARYVRSSTRWTRFLSAKDASDIYNSQFRADVERLEQTLGETLSAEWSFHDLQV